LSVSFWVDCEDVKDGLTSQHKFVYIRTFKKTLAEVLVCSDSVVNNRLRVGVVAVVGMSTCIELPQETSGGAWRIWVRTGTVHG
jgi:hypothetical protein